jgi:hypothetical protein
VQCSALKILQKGDEELDAREENIQGMERNWMTWGEGK